MPLIYVRHDDLIFLIFPPDLPFILYPLKTCTTKTVKEFDKVCLAFHQALPIYLKTLTDI